MNVQLPMFVIFLKVCFLKVYIDYLKRRGSQGGINSKVSTDFDNIPKVWRSSFGVWRSLLAGAVRLVLGSNLGHEHGGGGGGLDGEKTIRTKG